MSESAYSEHEQYRVDGTIIPDEALHTTASGRVRAVDCRECDYWFLGCLRGRAQWKDPSIRPNDRHIVNGLGEQAMRCDAFTWDHDEDRRGRCVVP